MSQARKVGGVRFSISLQKIIHLEYLVVRIFMGIKFLWGKNSFAIKSS